MKYSKILPNVNTSFVVIVDQINCMLVTNDNMYMFNQKMKTYFVECYVLDPKTMSLKIMVTCNLSNATSEILITYLFCD